jgi:hypothetical protein
MRALATTIALAGLLGAAGCGLVGLPGTSGGKGGTSSTAVLTASSTKVNFGNVTVGASTAQLVTLTNTGKANVNISTVAATGSGFSASGGSNVILTPNQSVTISVNFDPPSAGGLQGTLSVSSNASNPMLQIGLSGSGFPQTGQQTVPHSVTLNWQPSLSQVIGYFVYRGTGASLSKLSGSMDVSTTFTDSTVADGQTYVYAVTSVDSSNVESAHSLPISVTIPSQ